MTDQIPAGESPLGSLACPEPEDRPDLWPTTARRTADGELALGGLTVSEILADAPSPVFVLDEADLRGRAASWSAAMAEEFWPNYGMAGGEAFYAGKAFLTTKVAQWVLEEGMGIDTASRVELAVGLAGLEKVDGYEATTRARRLGLHGNGKTPAEVTTAVRHRVGHLVIDSPEEVDYAAAAVHELRRSGDFGPAERARVMVRLTTGIHAGGHEYISTAHEDQKFGLSLASGQALGAVTAIQRASHLDLRGLHSHIGSQIFGTAAFVEAARKVIDFAALVRERLGLEVSAIDLGGGVGIAYTAQDPVPTSPVEVARALAGVVRERCAHHGLPIPRVTVEPGRSIAGPSMVMLYRVGVVKDVSLEGGGVRRYVAIDGGMSDNIRPVLYGAAYTATLANRDGSTALARCRVVGKHCESGDIVIRDVDLPADIAGGDLLAVPAVGAYGYSMASNYNMATKPGVLAVEDGEAHWFLRPQSVDHLLALDAGLE